MFLFSPRKSICANLLDGGSPHQFFNAIEMPLTNSEQIDARRNLKQAMGNLRVKTLSAQGGYVATTSNGYVLLKSARGSISAIRRGQSPTDLRFQNNGREEPSVLPFLIPARITSELALN